MATYTYKRCPHCLKTYESYSTHTKSFQEHSGVPFITCPKCGKLFVDKDIQEPALKPFSASEMTIKNCIFACFYPFGVAGILFTFAAFKVSKPEVWLFIVAGILDLFYILSIIYFLLIRRRANEQLKKEYEESIKRLQNPEYARALKEAGFHVPSWFSTTQEEE